MRRARDRSGRLDPPVADRPTCTVSIFAKIGLSQLGLAPLLFSNRGSMVADGPPIARIRNCGDLYRIKPPGVVTQTGEQPREASYLAFGGSAARGVGVLASIPPILNGDVIVRIEGSGQGPARPSAPAITAEAAAAHAMSAIGGSKQTCPGGKHGATFNPCLVQIPKKLRPGFGGGKSRH
jgi:hypothetical protein